VTHLPTGHAGPDCSCQSCAAARALSTRKLELELSRARSADWFDAVLAELSLRLEARAL
jgi:hypothetical protein